VVLTPNEGELAELLGMDAEEVKHDPRPAAVKASAELGAVVAVRGWVVAPDGRQWPHEGGTVGLGTSGSGDVKSGVIAGLLARGASPEQAAVWGVYAHSAAGELLSVRIATVGYLARELIDVIPEVLTL
jgi:NAD(P)H-hydrate repair Nnr-like enzyme with NAD(P)H-hydrate dehydratase domain